ncbi:MAG: ABC transporter ATP-binding protein [Clostridia bacterium]|nr:ABC transporter ATP-binding protein [Clostridia bacterium]
MISIKNFTKKYNSQTVYENFNLDIEESGVTCILGESGCGKTTLLNAVAGLIKYEGEITKKSASYVFQTPRLVPNLTVENNLRFTGTDGDCTAHMLERTGLKDKMKSYPAELSGGEAQRVSLCRAFLKKADVLLMDEPFSSLDLKTKISVMKVFKELQAEEERGVIFVTHDIDEALYLADRIIVMRGGSILKDLQNESKGEFGANSPLRETIIKALLCFVDDKSVISKSN